MNITRRYTVEGQDPFAAFTFAPRTSRIANPDGSVVFEMRDLLAPEGWSQVAGGGRPLHGPGDGRPAGVRPAGRLLDLLGLAGRLLLQRARRAGVPRRD